jgi:hypothetical protein
MKWPETLSIADARKMQERMQKRVRIIPYKGEPR